MMTSVQIRQAYLDFFKSKEHSIVGSSSLMPDSPNLLFTNAGMNQFVPIFLGQTGCPYSPGRAADTQKCIRAGGKHNDLEDVGLDTYHHTFFEMLGNWSFGDYFKKEAIDWAWELITKVWKFPVNRVYATVYNPDKTKGDPSEFDQEAFDLWALKFNEAGLDPNVHIVHGNKKDNFWMMGETGPCGPCSELHIDLTPNGDTGGSLVNQGSPKCIEIWNLVFIQFNANQDGTFSNLPSQHVDTGMGFERVVSIIQGTKHFSDFENAKISNYETDIFRPIFDRLEQLSGKKYGSTLPKSGSTGDTEQEKIDVAFRVIADHIRTLSFAIADGIQPGNNDRNYVLRRILRRAVKYGRTLGFHKPFFFELVDVLSSTMGDIFPEIRSKCELVKRVVRMEEEAFNKTLDRGLTIFDSYTHSNAENGDSATKGVKEFSGKQTFDLYDTYGFPVDLTALLAREKGITIDLAGFEKLMEEQRQRARASQKREVISLSNVETATPTKFVGYENLESQGIVLEVVGLKEKTAVICDVTPLYGEMGGQSGDTGEFAGQGQLWRVVNTQKSGNIWMHLLETEDAPIVGSTVTLRVDVERRNAIQRLHTVTHLLHWALHEVCSKEVSQKGSFVGPDKLTFDFNSAPITPDQLRDIELLVNERILENAPVTWTEQPLASVKGRPDIMQFFGDKYGDIVRVVQVGGTVGSLNGYSMELCGGTHTKATGEIGLFRIISENAIAAGVRRIEAVAGLTAYNVARQELDLIRSIATKLNAPVGELEKKMEAILSQQKELEKKLRTAQQKQAASIAKELCEGTQLNRSVPAIIKNLGEMDGEMLQSVADALKGCFEGVVVLGSHMNGVVALVATVTPAFTKTVQAGKIIQTIASIVGGKGGGRPDSARGGGKDSARLEEALQHAAVMLG